MSKAHTRNHRHVAFELTKAVVNAHKHHEPLLRLRYSRALYQNDCKLFLNALERAFPSAVFGRTMLPSGVYVWCPENDAAEELLRRMTPEEATAFILHPPAERQPMECESRRIMDGARFKSLRRGQREADVFPNTAPRRAYTARKAKKLVEDHFGDKPIPLELINSIRQRITEGTF